MPPKIEMDLKRDIARQLVSLIRSWGYECADDEPLLEIGCRFQMLQARVPPPQPRELIFATGFICPPDQQRGLWEFRVRSRSGAPLKPFLSRTSQKADFRDGMLIDWGILHFHLSDELQADGFVRRSDDVLFAMVRENAIYCIGFWPHKSWSKQDVIGIVHDNWPRLIEQYRVKGLVGLSRPITDQDVEKLRKANINTIVEPRPAAFYLGPGGGMASSGHSIVAVTKTSYLLDVIEHLEDEARKSLETIGRESCQLLAHLESDRVSVKDESGNVIVWHRI